MIPEVADRMIDKWEPVYKAMREIDAKALKYQHEHQRLSPPYGAIAVGGAHMDPFFRAEGLWAFLASLGGQVPVNSVLEEAEQAGHEASAFAISKWNASRLDHVVHRYAGSADAEVTAARRRIEQAIREVSL